jgi:hypothetical protein
MSALLYGTLTKTREETPLTGSYFLQTTTAAGTPTYTPVTPPPIQTYLDALAALVPAEALAAHTVILANLTQESTDEAGNQITTITNSSTLVWVFWALIGLSLFLYVVGHGLSGWDWPWDYIRVVIPALAFVGWTMAQAPSAFDAVFPNINTDNRWPIVVIGAIVLGVVAGMLGYEANKKPVVKPNNLAAPPVGEPGIG